MESDMSIQVVKKADLAGVISRWLNGSTLTDVNELEVIEKQRALVIKKPRQGQIPSKSAVLETRGTIRLDAKTVHEIALSPELLYDD
jgi:hypothetical protein